MIELLLEILLAILILALLLHVLKSVWPSIDQRVLGLIAAIAVVLIVLSLWRGGHLHAQVPLAPVVPELPS